MSAPDFGPLTGVTARQVLDWARAQPAETVIGVCDAAGECLIAAYAEAVISLPLHIYPYGLFDGSPPCYMTAEYEWPLPQDLIALGRAFDALTAWNMDGWPDDHRGRYTMYPADLARLAVQP